MLASVHPGLAVTVSAYRIACCCRCDQGVARVLAGSRAVLVRGFPTNRGGSVPGAYEALSVGALPLHPGHGFDATPACRLFEFVLDRTPGVVDGRRLP